MALRKFILHLTRQTYEELGDGLVRITNPDGKTGVFKYTGEWVEGDVRDASLNMLVYTGGPDCHPDFTFRWTMLPADTSRPSGWPEKYERHLKAVGTI
jgi:hypothetical protein